MSDPRPTNDPRPSDVPHDQESPTPREREPIAEGEPASLIPAEPQDLDPDEDPTPQPREEFGLETLEPRILMSASWLEADTFDPAEFDVAESGTERSDLITGGAGHDLLIGRDGHDRLRGDEGDDVLIGGDGRDDLRGGDGDDRIDGGADGDEIDGGAGHDILWGGEGNDVLDGGEGNDLLEGGDGYDRIDGGAGNDSIRAGDGNDRAQGGDGNDRILGDGGNDRLYGGAGNDVLEGGAGSDQLYGGDDHDVMHGGDGNDRAYGGAGNDTLTGGRGQDRLDGGSGDDVLDGGEGGDKIAGGYGNDHILGGDGDDRIDGGGGSDSLRGDDGDDWLYGGSDDDTLSGGAGDDRLYGESGDDHLMGGAGEDRLDGAIGNDLLSGEDGNDYLRGGSGEDVLLGGAGDDYLSGDQGDDTILGGAGDDLVKGGSGNDTLSGNEGDDDLRGGSGNDFLRGGTGNDVLRGESGHDIADYSDAGHGVVVDITSRIAQDTGQGWDSFIGMEGVKGSDFDDVFQFETPKRGGTYTIDGHGGINLIDLSNYTRDQVTFLESGTELEVDTGSGGKFSIEYDNIHTFLFADDQEGAARLVQGLSGGPEDTILPLTILPNLPHVEDGAELKIRIEGVPDDASLSAGMFVGNGRWVLDIEDLEGLTVEVAEHFGGTLDLNVMATVTDMDAPVAIDFAWTPIEEHGAEEHGAEEPAVPEEPIAPDSVGEFLISEDGHQLDLMGHGWKSLPLPYTVTEATILEFDVRLPEGDSIQGVGFDHGVEPTQSRTFNLGSDAWGLKGFEMVEGEDGWAHVRIEVGRSFTGDFDRLVFVNDPEGSGTAGTVEFRDVLLHEGDDIGRTDYFESDIVHAFQLHVEAVADAPVASAVDAVGVEDMPIPLELTASLVDQDGSETLSYRVTGVPEGGSFSGGTDLGDGVWELETLEDLTFTGPEHVAGTFAMTFEAWTTEEMNDDQARTAVDFQVEIAPVTDADAIEGTDVVGSEDATIPLEIAYTAIDTDGSEVSSAVVSGVPEGAQLSSGTDLGDGTWIVDPADLNDLSFTPPPGVAGTFELTIDVTSHETDATDDPLTASASMQVTVKPVANGVAFDVASVTGSEDSPIALELDFESLDQDGSETFELVLRGVPEGATLSAGTDLGDGNWSLAENDLETLELTPPTDAAGTYALSLEITSRETTDPDIMKVDTVDFEVTVTPTVDGALASSEDVAGIEDTAVALDLDLTALDTDGSETHTVRILGLPAGAQLSAGQDLGDGVWSVAPSELDGLAFLPGVDASGTFELTFEVTTTDPGTADEPHVTSSTFEVAIAAQADGVDLTALDVTGLEDTPIPLSLDFEALDVDGSETHTVLISGLPNGAVLSAGMDLGDGIWSVDPADLDGLTLTPPPHMAATFTLEVTLSSTDGDSERVDQASFDVVVTPTIDGTTLSVADVVGDEDTAIPIDVQLEALDTDGSETRTVLVSGLPAGGTLSVGADLGNGTWSVPPEDLPSLQFLPPTNASGTFSLTLLVTTDDPGTDDDPLQVATTFDVVVTPTLDGAALGAGDVAGFEDSPIALDLSLEAIDTDGSEVHRITIAGVPDGASLSAGSDQGNGVWTLDPDQLSGLTFTPPEHASETFAMTYSVTTTESDSGESETRTERFDVTVQSLVDGGTLTTTDATGDEDQPIALDIQFTELDTDGSESHVVVIGGIPLGGSLSHGVDQGDGTWVVQPSDLAGLTFQAGANVSGSFDLSVSCISTEGGEDSIAEAELSVTVHAIADAPVTHAGAGAGEAGTTFPIPFDAELTDDDGSESKRISLDGTPLGSVVTDGDRTWTSTGEDAQLDLSDWGTGALEFTPPSDFDGEVDLQFRAESEEQDGDQAQTIESLPIVIEPTVDPVPVTIEVDELELAGRQLAFPLPFEAPDLGAQVSISTTVQGLPAGATLTDGETTLTIDSTSTVVDLSDWSRGDLVLTLPDFPTADGPEDVDLKFVLRAQDDAGRVATTASHVALTFQEPDPTEAPSEEPVADAPPIELPSEATAEAAVQRLTRLWDVVLGLDPLP